MKSAHRFWEKVEILGENECWPWKAYRDKRGYGKYWYEGKMIKAHRFSLFISRGELGEGYSCLHSCDNPCCCNPKHLSWGTHQDNSDDQISRNRQYKGESHHNSLYNNEIVDSILRMKMHGFNIHEISSKLGLKETGVINVYIGRSWKHRHGVDGNPTLEEIKNKKPDRRKSRKNQLPTSPTV